jgi:hypothetical protein
MEMIWVMEVMEAMKAIKVMQARRELIARQAPSFIRSP